MSAAKQIVVLVLAGFLCGVGCEPQVNERELGTILDKVPKIKPLKVPAETPQPEPGAKTKPGRSQQDANRSKESQDQPATKTVPSERTRTTLPDGPQESKSSPIGPVEPPPVGE